MPTMLDFSPVTPLLINIVPLVIGTRPPCLHQSDTYLLFSWGGLGYGFLEWGQKG